MQAGLVSIPQAEWLLANKRGSIMSCYYINYQQLGVKSSRGGGAKWWHASRQAWQIVSIPQQLQTAKERLQHRALP